MIKKYYGKTNVNTKNTVGTPTPSSPFKVNTDASVRTVKGSIEMLRKYCTQNFDEIINPNKCILDEDH